MPTLIISNAQETSLASRQQLDGREHLVVPVIAIKAGVLNGTLYTAQQIKTFAEAWNGVPVPVGHPKKNNAHVSANAPEFESTTNIGKFFNAHVDDDALKGEIWIDIDKANRLGHESIVAHFDDGNLMEVSTGLFCDTCANEGTFNDKPHTQEALNIRPDHLALLPNEAGACSIADGCGAMRTHNKEEATCCNACFAKEKAKNKRSLFAKLMQNIGGALGFKANEESHADIRDGLNSLLDAQRLDSDEWSFVVDVFDEHFIFEKNDRLYKQGYEHLDGKFVLRDDAVEVERLVTYEPISGVVVGNNADEVKEKGMSKKDLVMAIIGNSLLPDWGAEDEKTLMGMEEAVLTKIEAPAKAQLQANEAAAAAAAAEAKSEADKEAQKPAGVTLSDADLATFHRLKANEDNRIKALRTNVAQHYAHLTDEDVAAMPVATVEALAKGIEPTANFAGRGGSATQPKVNEQKYVKPAVFLDKEAA